MDDYDVPPTPSANAWDNEHSSSWKTTGITSIDGTLYLILAQDTYKDSNNRGRETARNATIIKSTDHGKTWSGSEQQSVQHPIFPGERFATPTFIQYGRDGVGGEDGGEKYLYAISNDGSWDNGDALFLGRVARADLPRLRATDWTFYAGSHWTRNIAEAQPLLRAPNRLSSSSAMYDPALHTYLLATWNYPGCTGYIAPGCDVHHSQWTLYQAPKPWGPWRPFQQFNWFPAGYYNPVLVNKFLSSDGTQGWIFYSGYFWGPAWYFFTAAPFVLDVVPTRTINDSDTQSIQYRGHWTAAPGNMGQFGNDLHYSPDSNGSASVNFNGCGIRMLSDMGSDRGDMEVYLDRKFQAIVSARYLRPAGLQLAQRILWSASHLPPGAHVLEIRNHGAPYIAVDSFVISGCGKR
jgi:hypothetical protein